MKKAIWLTPVVSGAAMTLVEPTWFGLAMGVVFGASTGVFGYYQGRTSHGQKSLTR